MRYTRGKAEEDQARQTVGDERPMNNPKQEGGHMCPLIHVPQAMRMDKTWLY